MLKRLMIDEAKAMLSQLNETPNDSKLCVMTGVHRKDITRLTDTDSKTKKPDTLLRRVVERWQQDKQYVTKNGKPKVLSCDGPGSDFFSLVEKVSSDLNPATILRELERIGLVVKTPKGTKLLSRIYNPRGEPKKGYELLARDTADLISAVDANINSEEDIPNLHIKTEYDHIISSALPEIRQWLFEEGSQFHQRARSYLSQFDTDINKQLKQTALTRVAVGSFSLTCRNDNHVK